MKIALISSTKDTASANLKDRLLESYEFAGTELEFDKNQVYGYLSGKDDIKLYTIETPLITRDNLDKEIDADIFLFLSRHRAEGGRASLTVHPIGNFGENKAGGKAGKLGVCHAGYFKRILKELTNNVEGSQYEATLESTHHGPYMDKPALFVELGSNETFWEDIGGARIVVRSVMNVIENNADNNQEIPIDNNPINKNNKNLGIGYKVVFVIGGSHYSHIASKLLLNSEHYVSHICPKHNLEHLNEDTLKQAMERSVPKADFVLLDWKGLGAEKQRILELLEKCKVKYERSDKFF